MGFAFAALPAYPEDAVPTAPLLEHLAHLRKSLDQAERMLRTLEEQSPATRAEYRYQLDRFLCDGLDAHLHAETQTLYQVAAHYIGGAEPISPVLTEGVARVRELISAFHRQLTRMPDDSAALRLLGLQALDRMRAHFAEEEALLFPELDLRMRPADVERELVHLMVDHTFGTGPTDHRVSDHHMKKFHTSGE